MQIAENSRINELTGKIIAAAIKVHRALGLGLLESVYLACLLFEVGRSGTYLKLTGYPVGLLMNFNVPLLKHGIKRLVNPDPASERRP
jgi:hypothetical protein